MNIELLRTLTLAIVFGHVLAHFSIDGIRRFINWVSYRQTRKKLMRAVKGKDTTLMDLVKASLGGVMTEIKLEEKQAAKKPKKRS